jgi:hypothetical protein
VVVAKLDGSVGVRVDEDGRRSQISARLAPFLNLFQKLQIDSNVPFCLTRLLTKWLQTEISADPTRLPIQCLPKVFGVMCGVAQVLVSELNRSVAVEAGRKSCCAHARLQDPTENGQIFNLASFNNVQ